MRTDAQIKFLYYPLQRCYFSNFDQKLKLKSLSFFHVIINYYQKDFNNFNHFINYLNLDIDFLGICESRILKSQFVKKNIGLQNYLIEQTPTESTSGGVLLFINKKDSYKTCPDLSLHSGKKTWVYIQ